MFNSASARLLRDPRIDALVSAWREPARPGGAVAVVRDGEVLHRGFYGLADLEASLPVDASTRFALCSVTKQMTAACLLLLEEEGRVGLDDEVHAYAPQFPDHGAPITLRQLASNTSGLRDYFVLAMLAGVRWGGRAITAAVKRELILGQRTLAFAPGAQYRYSNTNFVLLAWILERLEGRPLPDVFRDRLFAPLGMTSSLFGVEHAQPPERAVVGYLGSAGAGFARATLALHQAGDGGAWSTLDDMIRWERAFDRDLPGSPGLLRRLAETPRVTDGAWSWYGLGLGTGTHRGQRWEAHSGGLPGFAAHRVRFPEARLSVIALANNDLYDLEDLCYDVADLYLDAAGAGLDARRADLDRPALDAFSGFYQDTGSGLAFEVESSGRGIALSFLGGRFELQPEPAATSSAPTAGAPLRFASARPPLWAELVTGPAGPLVAVSIAPGHCAHMVRSPSSPAGDLPAGIAGSFRSEELGSTYTIEDRGGAAHLTCEGRFGRLEAARLERVGPETFYVADAETARLASRGSVVLWLPGSGEGESGAESLVVSAGKAEGLRFSRVA